MRFLVWLFESVLANHPLLVGNILTLSPDLVSVLFCAPGLPLSMHPQPHLPAYFWLARDAGQERIWGQTFFFPSVSMLSCLVFVCLPPWLELLTGSPLSQVQQAPVILLLSVLQT